MVLTIKQFISFLKRKNKALPDYSSHFVEFIKEVYPHISNFKVEDKKYEETPQEICNLHTVVKKMGDYAIAYINSSKEFDPVYYNTPSEDITKDLEYIKTNSSHPDTFYVDDYNGGVIIFQKEIITKDVYRDLEFNFGIFKFTMGKNVVKMSTISSNTQRNGMYHPYQVGDKVCLGSFKDAYITAMLTHNFYAAYTLVMQCLTVYGGDMLNGRVDGPQNPIELWVGQICSVCDSQVKTDDIKVCNSTNRAICPNCVDSAGCIDEIDGEIYHPDVLKSCSACGKSTSTVIRKTCLSCRKKAVL